MLFASLDWLVDDYHFTGTAIAVTTIATVWITQAYYTRQNALSRHERFNNLVLKAIDLQTAFWSSKTLDEARRKISCKEEWEQLRLVLQKRLQQDECLVSGDEYVCLGLVDELYAAVGSFQKIEAALGIIPEDRTICGRFLFWICGRCFFWKWLRCPLVATSTKNDGVKVESIARDMIRANFEYWVDVLEEKGRRQELRAYVSKYWKSVKLPPATDPIAAHIGITKDQLIPKP
jgi:hypothetical protein